MNKTESSARLFALGPASNQADLALTRAVIGSALIRANDLSGARRLLSAAESMLRQSRGDAHYGTLLAQSYLALLDATPENRTARDAIADRIDAELGWQFGASTLANLLRSATPLKRPGKNPLFHFIEQIAHVVLFFESAPHAFRGSGDDLAQNVFVADDLEVIPDICRGRHEREETGHEWSGLPGVTN